MGNKIIYKIMIMVLVGGAISFSGCKSESAAIDLAEDETNADTSTLVLLTPEQFANTGIVFSSLQHGRIDGTLHVDGIIKTPPGSRISLTFPYGGIVRDITIREGEFVKKGSVLATLENPEFIDLQEKYLKDRSALEYAKLEFDRQEKLYQADVAAGKSFQKAKSEYEQLNTSVRAVEQKLRLIGIDAPSLVSEKIQAAVNIYAPDNGYIVSVSANRGKHVAPQEELLQLNSLKNAYLDLTVFEKDMRSVKPGQEVTYVISDNQNEEEKAKINIIGSEVRADRSVSVQAIPLKKSRRFLPGALVYAIIRQTGVMADILPSEAVVHFRGKQYVFVKTGDFEFRMLPVQTGAESDNFVQITLSENIPPDTQIVTDGAFNLLAVLKNKSEEH